MNTSATNRIGTGYDVHRLVAGRPLILGGVEIPFEKGVLGHSDGDALTHAICDALLGAAAMGDIGQHFPDTQEQYAGANSLTFLSDISAKLTQAGFQVGNVDATIVLQAPKLAPHIAAMRKNLARAMGCDISQVSVKATTTEGLDFTGTGAGVAVQAVALIVVTE
ncbi:MAG: 2-C-methyl-D-erythritol 2,4-cyclodiphosphate synthase [Candidatus Marinimicrobia bacterium]|nr:2-C-methyl-D-erythritol 2,4-cyclodiphosphate synthase [Candidatus Neomarinimicrobiota bacterium]MCF7840824.1 2-C-methyl-D-erythritol 2,4-cyclodiphosphate synthase [Candidatus Neomarinimicrobiota bacterium]MCF7902194.1 2-C-methyl-D-erythritol 2,4-cyclodiphosphate synthase [Candidatus Neomarinimicrobiota bacterium]